MADAAQRDRVSSNRLVARSASATRDFTERVRRLGTPVTIGLEGPPSRPRRRRLRAKHALGLALEGPRVMPCHIALPEISETFGQSGHITHLLAGEAASHTPQVPGPEMRSNGRPRPTRSEARIGRVAARPKSALFACSARPGRE
jgi:hypothetical protein